MTDPHVLLSNARKELAELEGKMAFLHGRISALTEVVGGPATSTPQATADRTQAVPTDGPVQARVAEPGSLADNMVAVFRSRGGPMRVKEIVLCLKAAGVTTDAKLGMVPNVFSVLGRREDLFEKVERGLYRLREAKT